MYISQYRDHSVMLSDCILNELDTLEYYNYNVYGKKQTQSRREFRKKYF